MLGTLLAFPCRVEAGMLRDGHGSLYHHGFSPFAPWVDHGRCFLEPVSPDLLPVVDDR